MKNTTKLMITILVLFLLTIGLTYAYFSLDINGDSNDVKASVGRLSLNYMDGPEIIANKIHPGWNITKEVSVENTGTYGVYYSINWIDLINDIINDEMVIRATCTEIIGEETNDCGGLDNTPISSNEIISNAYIDVDSIHTYQITVEFIETSSEQNYNQNKKFSGTLNIVEDDEIITLSGILEDENGNGIEGATVEVHSDPKYAITNELGAYEIRGVELGSHNLFVYDNESVLLGNTQIEIQTTDNTSEIKDNKILINKEESVTQKLVTKVNLGNSTVSLNNIVTLPKITYDMNISGQSTNITGAPQNWNKYGNLITPSEEGYEFLGWYTDPTNGTKIESNTSLISLSSHTLYAHWQSLSGIVYKVRHFKMNISGEYPQSPFEEEELSGIGGSTISPGVKTYDGFTSPSVQTTTILANGSRIVNYYYTRNQYTLSLVSGNGISTVTGAGTYYYGQSVNISATSNGGSIFHKWESSGATTTTFSGSINNQTIVMGIENTTLIASALPSTYSFDYTGNYQTFETPFSGYYVLEVWGAQGGSADATYYGGYGGYSTGVVNISAGTSLYVYAGGPGSCLAGGSSAGGFNGGGGALSRSGTYVMCSGGGASHIATSLGLLSTLSANRSSILIVAGGGGGSGKYSTKTTTGGAGGGIVGIVPVNSCTDCGTRSGGSQTAGGVSRAGTGSFGLANGSTSSYSCGGGGGFYGGAGDTYEWGGTGGSGYIANTSLISYGSVTKQMYCYNCTTSSVASTLTNTTTNVSTTATSNYAKKGNGYAKITYIGN